MLKIYRKKKLRWITLGLIFLVHYLLWRPLLTNDRHVGFGIKWVHVECSRALPGLFHHHHGTHHCVYTSRLRDGVSLDFLLAYSFWGAIRDEKGSLYWGKRDMVCLVYAPNRQNLISIQISGKNPLHTKSTRNLGT